MTRRELTADYIELGKVGAGAGFPCIVSRSLQSQWTDVAAMSRNFKAKARQSALERNQDIASSAGQIQNPDSKIRLTPFEQLAQELAGRQAYLVDSPEAPKGREMAILFQTWIIHEFVPQAPPHQITGSKGVIHGFQWGFSVLDSWSDRNLATLRNHFIDRRPERFQYNQNFR